MSSSTSAALGRVFALSALLLSGCANTDMRGDVASSSNTATASGACLATANYSSPTDQQENYKIQAGDELAITFYLNSEFDTDTTVRADGKIGLKMVGEESARGLTPSQLSAELDRAYSKELLDPSVSVLVKNSPSRVVYVQGQVDHPGAIPLQPDMTVVAAIAQAGGITDGANPDSIVLIRRDMCGEAHGQELKLGKALTEKTDTGYEQDAFLLPGDVLVVPRSSISNVGLFVKQYVKDLIPIQPYLPLL